LDILKKPDIDAPPLVGDGVKFTTHYLCTCRCGTKVYFQNGVIYYIHGTHNHQMNKGILYAKRPSGIKSFKSSERLQNPSSGAALGEKKFKKIDWDEALDIATVWLVRCHTTSPRKLIFFPRRDQSQSLTSWWAEVPLTTPFLS
jgi:anaerobic selenocysteine-containing dehydrogenase